MYLLAYLYIYSNVHNTLNFIVMTYNLYQPVSQMNMRDMFAVTSTTADTIQIVQWLKDHGLLFTNRNCPTCNGPMRETLQRECHLASEAITNWKQYIRDSTETAPAAAAALHGSGRGSSSSTNSCNSSSGGGSCSSNSGDGGGGN